MYSCLQLRRDVLNTLSRVLVVTEYVGFAGSCGIPRLQRNSIVIVLVLRYNVTTGFANRKKNLFPLTIAMYLSRSGILRNLPSCVSHKVLLSKW